MDFVRFLAQALLALLFIAFGSAMSSAAPENRVHTSYLVEQAGTQAAMVSAQTAESELLFQGSRGAIGQATVEAFQGLGNAALVLGGATLGNDQARAELQEVLGGVLAILSDPGSVPPAIAAELENKLIAANAAYQNGDFETAGKLVGELQLVTVGMVTGVGVFPKLGNNLTGLVHRNTVDAPDLVPQIRPVATSPLPDDWVTPSGYVKTSDGTVVHVETGQVYTPMRGADGALRTTTAGDPVFETQSAGATAQTTLTQDATSGQAIGLGAPNTARGADSVATYNPLRAELTAEEVAQGHAWTKHGYEFEDLGITQRYQFQNHVEDVINSPSDVRYYVDGRTVYIDSETRTVVVRNPGVGESTAFRPPEIDYNDYISSLPARTEPY